MSPIKSFCFKGNTRVYNLISVLQITWLLWGEAIISSETDCVMVAKRNREALAKLEIIKQS